MLDFIYSKGHVDIVYNSKIARFHGDICDDGFIAIVNSLEWISPNKGAVITEEDRAQLIRLINNNATPTKDSFSFVDDNYKSLDYYDSL